MKDWWMRVRMPETPHEPASWRTGHPVATAKTTQETGQKFRLILIWLTAKMCRNKGCLSPRIRIRPVSPPASYYPSFRRLYIQVNVRSTQYLAVQRSALIVDHNTYLFQNRGTEWLYYTGHWSVRGQTTDHAGDWLKNVVHCVHVTVSQAPPWVKHMKTVDGNTSMWQ